MWQEIAAGAASESALWAEALLAGDEQRRQAVFSSLAPGRHALGLETIYEGYLVHYGAPRLFAPADPDTALLLGDYLYAHGLVRVAATGDVAAVADLAELISLCAQRRAADADGDGAAWAATAALLGREDPELAAARDLLRLDDDPTELERVARASAGDAGVESALAAHRLLVG